MEHVEAHIEEVHSWPTACGCGVKVEDVNSYRHHLSDQHGLWKAEWRMFGQKRMPEDDEQPVLGPEEAGQTTPCQGEKRLKPGDEFVEWSPSLAGRSQNPPSSRTEVSNRRKVSRKAASNGTTFIQSSPIKAGSSDQPSGRSGGPGTGEASMSTPSTISHYPEPGWDSPIVTVFDDQDRPPDNQALLELPPYRYDRSDGSLTGDSIYGTLRLGDVTWSENSIADPTSMSTPVTDKGSDAFEAPLDPALFYLDGSSPQPLGSDQFHDLNTPQSDSEDDLDLPSLESLLRRTPAPVEGDFKLGHGKPAESDPSDSGMDGGCGS